MDNLQLTVNSNLADIVASTTLTLHLCNILKEKKLVAQEEYEKLTNFVRSGLHTEGASYLFTTIVRKIAEADEEKFIEALRQGQNDRLIEILKSKTSGKANGGRFPLRKLRKEEIEFLRGFQGGKFSPSGKFEGLHLGDENRGNEVLRGSVSGGGSLWTLLEDEGVVETAESDKFIGRVRSVVKCLGEGSLWWNPNAVPLPPNFIPRRVRRLTRLTTSDEEEEPQPLSELTKPGYPFLWLVDSPGGGKSTVTTKLEEEWRRSMPSNRVIVRINLNSIQPQLQQEKRKEDDVSLVAFLRRFVPFIPIDSLCLLPGGSVKVVLLLDALDEVLPLHKATMLRLLHKLLLSPHEAKERDFISNILRRPDLRESLRLQKLFLTTRPHLRSLVEKEFGVTAHSLLPLNKKEQVEFLSKEIAGKFELTKDEAKMKLESLPQSARSLLGNPLMLFLFAQVINHSGGGGVWEDLDLCGLYERFLVAKHAIHVAEKEAADPAHPNTQRRMKNLLEENLPFYYATALAQLKPQKKKEEWAKLVTLPDLAKREELLSFGLLTNANSSPHLLFVHLSFAEFLYARLLTTPSTPTPLRDALFSQIYSDYLSPLRNVEEFVLCTLRRRLVEFPGKRLLPLSPHWLPGSTLWQRLRGQKMGYTLRGFLEGRLFPLLGEELLSSVDLTHPKVIDILTYVAWDPDNLRLREWLTRRDPQWIRRRLFALPPTTTPTTTPTHDWDFFPPGLLTRLLCENPAFLPRCLSDEEIRSGLSACEDLVDIVCGYPNSRQCREIVERRMGRDALRVKMTTAESLETTLFSKEAAWWMAQTLTREQFTSLISRCQSRVLGDNLWLFFSAWGGGFVYSLIAGATGTTSKGHGPGNLSELGAEGLLRMFGGGAEGVAALRFLIPRVGDTRLLEELEELEERRGRGHSEGGATLLSEVFESEGLCAWDSVDKLPNVDLLPFVIRYGKCHKLQQMRPDDIDFLMVERNIAGTVGAAFVLSVLVDSTRHTFNQLKSIEITTERFQSSGVELWNFLSRVGVDDLRAASLSAGHSNVKGRWPLVRQVKWGQVVLSLLPQVPLTLGDDTLEAAVEDLLRHVACCEALDFLKQKSSLHKLLLRRVKSEVTRGRRHFNSPSLRCRLRGLITFALNVAREKFTRTSTKSAQLFVMSVIVEGQLPSPHGHTPQGYSQVNTLLPSLTQQLQTNFPEENKSPQRLVDIFGIFVSEWEWSVVLETLQLIPSHPHAEELPPESPRRFYGRPETPFLRVWLRHFGADETRKVAEDLDWWKYRGPRGEAVLLAVELGSLPILEKVGWPSLLWWRDEGGRSLLEIAVALWGEGHEVTSFLRGKFELTINSE